jgi:hypothetical protein
MLRLLLVTVALTLLASVALADEKKMTDTIREIAVDKADKIESKPGAAKKPTKITTAEELEKQIPDEATRKRLAKEVDFTTHTLLVFAWKGSGKDKIEYSILQSDPPQIEFTFTQGLTDDYRSHVKLFAVKNGLKWAVK